MLLANQITEALLVVLLGVAPRPIVRRTKFLAVRLQDQLLEPMERVELPSDGLQNRRITVMLHRRKSTDGRTRTLIFQLRSLTLYPLSYACIKRVNGSPEESCTLTPSLLQKLVSIRGIYPSFKGLYPCCQATGLQKITVSGKYALFVVTPKPNASVTTNSNTMMAIKSFYSNGLILLSCITFMVCWLGDCRNPLKTFESYITIYCHHIDHSSS